MSIKSINSHRGFTLLEALIGFLILSIGMLGIAALQAISLKAGKTSVYNSVAMMKVDELFESMRVNPTAAALLAYDAAGEGLGTNNSCSGTTKCTDVQLAQDDIFWWKKNVLAGLPAAVTTTVAVVASATSPKMLVVTVTVSWKERSKTDAANTVGVDKTYLTTANICTEIPC